MITLNARTGTVRRSPYAVDLSPVQAAIVRELLADPLLTPSELLDRVYAGARVPLSGVRMIHLQRIKANAKLALIGVAIATTRTSRKDHARCARYFLTVDGVSLDWLREYQPRADRPSLQATATPG